MKPIFKTILTIFMVIAFIVIAIIIGLLVFLHVYNTSDKYIQRDAECLIEMIDDYYQSEEHLPDWEYLSQNTGWDNNTSRDYLIVQARQYYYYIENDSVYQIKYINPDGTKHYWYSNSRIWQ